VFIAFASYPTIAFIRGPMRWWRRRSTGRCVLCGYDLTGNVSGACSECGVTIPTRGDSIAYAPSAHYDLLLMRWVADFAYLLAGLAYAPIALFNALVVGKNRRGWRQRFGGVPRFEKGRQRVWVHAVSLGEINATPKLIAAIRERRPDIDVVVSTTTDTGFARAVQLYGAERVFRYPFDFSLVVSRALRRIRPTMIVLVELEVWYNLVRMADARGIPVVVVNGRLTERSARRFARLGPLIGPMFRSLAWVGAQDESIAARFADLGVPRDRIGVTASLKWDSALVADEVPGSAELSRALGLLRDRPVWVCGSTGPGEEEIVLDAYRQLRDQPPDVARRLQDRTSHDGPTLCPTPFPGGGEVVQEALPNAPSRSGGEAAPILVVVPRKPERFDEVARMIERAGFGCVRRSNHPDGRARAALAPGEIVLGDTMGELRKFYSLADVVFVGRSLVPMGGSDPMEVAALGKPVVVGPHVHNFRDSVDALKARDAVLVVNGPKELAEAVGGLLLNPARAATIGAAGREVVKANQGATERTVAALQRLWRRCAKEE
jgi:3-deoxy-D-manno-octulosonic-acid transferase